MTGDSSVLVAGELRDFAERVEVPSGIRIRWLEADEPTPAGDHVGILPLLSRELDAATMDALPALRVIANYAVGHDNIDLAAAAARGIAVTNTPDVLTEATADLTWALVLAACRRLPEAQSLARSGDWAGWHPTLLLGMELRGRTLGILGAGRIGRAVGRRARPFGMDVTYWSRSRRPEWEREVEARRIDDLHAILAASDVLTIHLPLSEETADLIGADEIARMKEGAVLINTARGGIVDEDALCDALGSGRLLAAGLDVFADEPTIPERLRRQDRAVLLPHIGSATEEARWAMFELAWRNLIRGVRGEPLLTPVTGPEG